MLPGISVSKDTVVRLLTIVFTPVAAGVTAWAAKQGLNLPVAEVVPVAVGASAAVLGLGFHWLQKQPVVLRGEADLEKFADKIIAGVKTNDPDLAAAISALASKVDSQRAEILAKIDHGAPVAVQNVLQQLLNAAAQAPVAPVPSAVVPEPGAPIPIVDQPAA